MSREISLDEIRRALQWTTPGKWEYREDTGAIISINPPAPLTYITRAAPRGGPLIQDADWITHSRPYVEWLIHRVEQLQQENAELAAQIVGHAA